MLLPAEQEGVGRRGARADHLELRAEWSGAYEAALAEVAVLAANGFLPAAIELGEHAVDLLVGRNGPRGAVPGGGDAPEERTAEKDLG
ncbi:hypothetical protein Ssi03_36580 [Sphaerisporangium siamense]|uniref:Uncharacterized protein n=1 Tax=Sphaerisporangium siamense TaxID=795645 RepID=A0A7W7G9N2_9ACTN|nr:hypothetical protein [Sphaerisporangium siamense]MBB4701542.1 hypothetical protein [Sphaerisporangium siamense]GII85668.1 hypothetical protein Ssi03_36580 [Sphaerisporangium siamense]